ncbi:MAG: ribosomal RNA small subunit methyltransferase A [Deltaproteobacteria bacterium]|nr:ribosomal RNA small subunit methyltransferase A [Deltaproteobacteria bacterium]
MSDAGPPPRVDLAALLSQHRIIARKGLGQNFLHERTVLERIAASAVAGGSAWVVEIGAGLGTLTAALINAGAKVAAIERDQRLLPILEGLFTGRSDVRIVAGDALELRLASLVPAGVRPAVAGNLPYSISSPLLLALLGQRAEIGPATIMLQREVAERLIATPGTKAYGSLSVQFALHANLERVLDVGPGAFIPAPRVHSTVLRVSWLAAPRVEVGSPQLFERIVRAAFGRRRKTLRNALSAVFETEGIDRAAAAIGLDLKRRGETLTVSEFGALSLAFSELPAAAAALSRPVSEPTADS